MKKKNKLSCILSYLLVIICSSNAFGQVQIKFTILDIEKLPINIKYEGKIKNAFRWTDSYGDNIVITTETGVYQSNKFRHDTNCADAEIFAYHFLVKNNTAYQTWKVYDFISDCPVDIEASFIKNTFQVTDIDSNGIGEIWLMYKKVCHGDVSPCEMKIIMYQGQQKFAIRGQNRVQVTEKEYVGGEYKFDKAFSDGPKEFREFASKLWGNNIMQIWE